MKKSCKNTIFKTQQPKLSLHPQKVAVTFSIPKECALCVIITRSRYIRHGI